MRTSTAVAWGSHASNRTRDDDYYVATVIEFAIDSNNAQRVVQELLANGVYDRGRIGVEF